jgi:alkylation response protein AidB-like acyl-CoA dehydrogenase
VAALSEWGVVAAQLLFTEQGAANGTSSAIDDVIAHSIGYDQPLAVVHPAFGAKEMAAGRIEGDVVVVGGLGGARMKDADAQALVLARGEDGAQLGIVVPVSCLRTTQVGGIDPSLGLVRVPDAEVPRTAWIESRPANGAVAVAAARVAIGFELVGASRTLLRLACEHALNRVQFGRPIAGFQAVRHRLADVYVAIESAQAALEATCSDAGMPGFDRLCAAHAAMAKALAGLAARTAARHAQQVLGGMGFTTEHALNNYLRRVLVLDEMFASARVLTDEIGRRALAERHLPIDLPL